MAVLSIRALSELDLFAIYRDQHAVNQLVQSPRLENWQRIDLAIGAHLHEHLRDRLIAHIADGHRRVDLDVHPTIARYIACYDINRRRIVQRLAWLELPRFTESETICEIDFHHQLDENDLLPARPVSEIGRDLTAHLQRTVLDHLDQALHRFHMLLPRPMAYTIWAWHQEQTQDPN